jgi:hypothetical protein
MVGKGGLPRALNASQAERGQAALPNHELFSLELFSVSLCLCGAFTFRARLTWNFPYARAC